MKSRKFFFACMLMSAVAGGCSAGGAAADGVDGAGAAGTDSEDVRGSLIDTWVSGRTAGIYNIELTRVDRAVPGHKAFTFNARVDNGLRCVRAPCPSASEISGIYYVEGSKLTLLRFPGTPSDATIAHYYGEYDYSLTRAKLKLTKGDKITELTRAVRAPQCVEYDKADEDGEPTNIREVKNAPSVEAAERLLSQVGNIAHSRIIKGSCKTPTACPAVMIPVCGTIASQEPKTYSNLCMFAGALRERAGASSTAIGSWLDGACPEEISCSKDSDCDNQFCGWNASNARICKPYAQRGEHCGGFTMPQFRSFCAPGLECDSPRGMVDGGGTCK